MWENTVRYLEYDSRSYTTESFAYDLYCMSCGHKVDESEVLFVGGEWYDRHGFEEFGRPVEDLFIPPERVLELGSDPDEDELVNALRLSRIEQEDNGLIGFSFGQGTFYECQSCGKETPLRYDGNCRMCYAGEWTDRMQEDIERLANAVRELNGSFVHRLETHVDPFSINDRLYPDKILWRRGDKGQTTKLVRVAQCLKDVDDDHFEYILTDMEGETEWRLHEDDVRGGFWDTSLHVEKSPAIENDRIRELNARVD